MAQTLDGIIAHDSIHFANWTTKEDKSFFREETKKGGTIIFGRNTYKTFGDRPLPGRLNIVMTRDPKDKENDKPGVVEFFLNKKPKEVIDELKKRGIKKVFIGGGSVINSLFLNDCLIDEIWISVQPKVFGTGLKVFTDEKRDINLKLKTAKRSNQTVILKYGVDYEYSDKK